jgi:glycosyltransferase involved in cell wall biosynthesis
MIASQARFFGQRNHAVTVSCEKLGRGGRDALSGVSLQYLPKPARLLLPAFLRDRLYTKRAARFRSTARGKIIDHGQSVRAADISYVHNFMVPGYVDRLDGYLPDQEREVRFWDGIGEHSTIVANSQMVRRGLLELVDMPEQQVAVVYPGYDPRRFSVAARRKLRTSSRDELGVEDEQILIGLVTSGDFQKRGLVQFLDCIAEIRRENAGVRALVLGGMRRPRILSSHPLYQSGALLYQESSFTPEKYFAALDVFLYPARYEEFGIVVLEAMAMGIPVITSTAVGASELLLQAKKELVIGASGDDVVAYCDRVTQVLEMSAARAAELSSALEEVALKHTEEHHNEAICASLMPGE